MKKTIVFVKNSNPTESEAIKQFVGGEVLVLHRPAMTKEVEICEIETSVSSNPPVAPAAPVTTPQFDTTEPPLAGVATVRASHKPQAANKIVIGS